MKKTMRIVLIGLLAVSFVIGILATTTVEAKPGDKCFYICNLDCIGKYCCFTQNGIKCLPHLVPCCD